jgi:hypothetical protein
MLHYPIRYLLLSSSLLIFLGCSPAYKQMQVAAGDINSLHKFKPVFTTAALYNTQVDVVGNHLSGLLIIKKMPDSSIRMVFSNEVGFKFFDFEFAADGKFKVYSVIKQMNKKAVLKTLRHDFELILMEHTDSATSIRTANGLLYYIFPQKKGYNYYITDSTGNKLVRMERASKTKTVLEAIMENYTSGTPDTIGITHKTFNFTIGLKKIERDNVTQ